MDRVGYMSGQSSYWSKRVRVKTNYFKRVRSGLVGLGPYFHMIFFFLTFLKKNVFVIWKVIQQITLCKMNYFEFTTHIKNERN